MIIIARAEDTRPISDGDGGFIAVPDLKIPRGIEWGASAPDDQSFPNFQVHIEHNGRTTHTLWLGPYNVGGQKLYIVDAPKRVLQMLKNQLGPTNAVPFVRALRTRPSLRTWAKTQGFTLIRNSAGNPVGVRSPLVISGNDGGDLDLDEGQTIDDIPEMRDLE